MILINEKDRKNNNFLYPDHMIAAFLGKESMSFWDRKSNWYNRVYLEESSKEKINTSFLKLLNEINTNLHYSYMSGKYSRAFNDLVHRYVSPRVVKAKTKLTAKQLVKQRLISDESDYIKQVDIELSVKTVSKELFTSLIKLNEKLIKTKNIDLKPIEATDKALIEEFYSELPKFTNMTFEGWVEWLNNKNKEENTEGKSENNKEKYDGMER